MIIPNWLTTLNALGMLDGMYGSVTSALEGTVSSWGFGSSTKQGWQHADDQRNLLKHLGGMGPYVPASGFGIEYEELPESLEVDRVFVLARHGERYPTVPLNKQLRATYDKLKAEPVENYTGPMSFVKDWEYYIDDESVLEMETNTSEFAGLKDMRAFGKQVRERYGHLYNKDRTMPFFAAGQQRVIDSARAFSEGFIGSKGDNTRAELVVLPEENRMGYNTLTTGHSCKPYHKKSNYPHPYIPELMEQEAKRLSRMSPGFHLNAADVENLATYCAFELNAKGYSEVCNALSMSAFIEHEYMHDAELWYTKAKHPYTFLLGSVYVNATLTLLNEEDRVKKPEKQQKLWFSFSHDTDLLYYMNALGVLDHQTRKLPLDKVEFGRFFKTSELIPMGARIVVERLNDKVSGEKYVRVLVNDAVMPLKNCQDGPYMTCKLDTLSWEFYNRLSKHASFKKSCKIKKKRPQAVSFYWDWKDGRYSLPEPTPEGTSADN